MQSVLETLIGFDAARDFESDCESILAEAIARAHNPIDGNAAWISAEEKTKVQAGIFLAHHDLVQATERGTWWVFAVTTEGRAAYQRLEELHATITRLLT